MKRELPSVDDMARYEETHFFKEKIDVPAEESRFRLRIVSGRSNPELALDICKILKVEESEMNVVQLKNQELSIHLEDSVFGDDVYLVQPMCEAKSADGSLHIDVNTACMELLYAIQHLRLNGAARTTALVPYYSYARQDRKVKPRVPIAASALAQLLQCTGVDRVVTVDLHRGQVQGFFHNCPVDNIPTHLEFSNYVKEVICREEGVVSTQEELTIVAPDANGVERARVVANDVLARSVVTVLTRQVKEGERIDLVGDVAGQVCVVIDDLIDTGISVVQAAETVMKKGAKAVYAVVTHGILSNPEQVLNCKALKRLVVTDSVNLLAKPALMKDKLHVITIAPMMAQAIHRCHNEISLAAVFN